MTDFTGQPGAMAPLPVRAPVLIPADHEQYCPFCGSYRADTRGPPPAEVKARRRRRRRRAVRLVRVTTRTALLSLLMSGAAFGVIAAVTPPAGHALTMAQALARSRHVSWPAPPVPERFARALVATEDHRFYSEPGIDPIAVGRVLLAAVTGGGDQGGSTIEFQLARMLYTPGGSGPGAQAEIAGFGVKLSIAYSKQEILALYAETAYFGQGFYGLQAAACGYFGYPPAMLTVAQAALLAGLVNAPSADDPLVHPAAARAREEHVLGRMVATGDLTQAQAGQALRQPLGLTGTQPLGLMGTGPLTGTGLGAAPGCPGP